MKVKDIKELLAKLDGETDILIELDPNGSSNTIESIVVNELKDANNETVLVFEEVCNHEAGAPVFDDQIRLGIPNEYIAFCEINHTSPKEVLHGFIADLLALDNCVSNPRQDNLSRNGSDECDCAEAYFMRVGYQHREDD